MLHKKLLVLLTLLLSTSCISTANYNYREQNIFSNSMQTLVRLETRIVMGDCKDNKCKTAHSEKLSVGSGFFIGEDKHGMLVATAAHVCQEDKLVEKAKSFFGKLYVNTAIVTVLATVDHRYYTMEILKVDRYNDLCLGHVRGLHNEPYLHISNRVPNHGEEVYNVSAPAGIMHKNAPVMLTGIFSGNDTDIGISVISMLVKEGASGSPILDYMGKVIGIVSMKNSDVNYIIYSPSIIDLHNFY